MTPVTRTGAPRRAPIHLAIVLTVAAALLAVVLPQVSPAQATTSVASEIPPSGAVPSGAAPTVHQMTQRVVDETNAIRSEQGLPALVRDARLDQVAADWAQQQWRNGAMSHNPNYSTQIPAGWQRAGENVAKGYTSTQVVTAWKNSSSHYANLVHDYTSVGVGYFEQDGRRYWSQVFAKYPGTVPPAPAASPTPAAAPAPSPASPATPPGSTASPAAEPAAPAPAPSPAPSRPTPAPTAPTEPAPAPSPTPTPAPSPGLLQGILRLVGG